MRHLEQAGPRNIHSYLSRQPCLEGGKNLTGWICPFLTHTLRLFIFSAESNGKTFLGCIILGGRWELARLNTPSLKKKSLSAVRKRVHRMVSTHTHASYWHARSFLQACNHHQHYRTVIRNSHLGEKNWDFWTLPKPTTQPNLIVDTRPKVPPQPIPPCFRVQICTTQPCTLSLLQIWWSLWWGKL